MLDISKNHPTHALIIGSFIAWYSKNYKLGLGVTASLYWYMTKYGHALPF